MALDHSYADKFQCICLIFSYGQKSLLIMGCPSTRPGNGTSDTPRKLSNQTGAWKEQNINIHKIITVTVNITIIMMQTIKIHTIQKVCITLGLLCFYFLWSFSSPGLAYACLNHIYIYKQYYTIHVWIWWASFQLSCLHTSKGRHFFTLLAVFINFLKSHPWCSFTLFYNTSNL